MLRTVESGCKRVQIIFGIHGSVLYLEMPVLGVNVCHTSLNYALKVSGFHFLLIMIQ
jgi:hypothetical protein